MKQNTTATWLLLIGTFFWGVTFVVVKEAIAEINIYRFLAWRFTISTIGLAIFFLPSFRLVTWKMIRYGVFLGIILTIGYVTQTVGLIYTSASKAAFITGLSVVLVPLMMALVQRRSPSAMQWLATIMATIGVALLTLSSSIAINPGDIWVLACAVTFAVYILLVSKYSRIFAAIPFTVIQLVTVSLISALVATGIGEWRMPHGYIVWQAIIICSLFATSFMYAVQNHYQKFISEVKAVIIYSMEPLFAAVAAYFYLQEQITVRMICGGALILIGMLCSELQWENVVRKLQLIKK
ncbi:DMT family transporter [candidate division KSB1 bacterium]|nr:DMT family transporter [candidate division KSB1 bacterium]